MADGEADGASLEAVGVGLGSAVVEADGDGLAGAGVPVGGDVGEAEGGGESVAEGVALGPGVAEAVGMADGVSLGKGVADADDPGVAEGIALGAGVAEGDGDAAKPRTGVAARTKTIASATTQLRARSSACSPRRTSQLPTPRQHFQFGETPCHLDRHTRHRVLLWSNSFGFVSACASIFVEARRYLTVF